MEPALWAEPSEARHLGRLEMPQDIANAVYFFAPARSDYTIGAVLDVSGGIYMN